MRQQPARPDHLASSNISTNSIKSPDGCDPSASKYHKAAKLNADLKFTAASTSGSLQRRICPELSPAASTLPSADASRAVTSLSPAARIYACRTKGKVPNTVHPQGTTGMALVRLKGGRSGSGVASRPPVARPPRRPCAYPR